MKQAEERKQTILDILGRENRVYGLELSQTTANLAGLHADKAFIGVNGVDPQHGLTTQNMLECEVKKNIIEASTQCFVLADASKMRCVALGVICPTSRVDFIITDGGVPPGIVEALENSGVEVVVAD